MKRSAHVRLVVAAWVAVLLAGVLSVAPAEASTDQARQPTPRIQVAWRTSPIFLSDPSPTGEFPPTVPTTTASATLRNCPQGEYTYSASLVQDRKDVPAAGGGLGAGEISCPGKVGTALQPVGLSTSFARDGLHRGFAVASFAVYEYGSETPIASSTSLVWIPRSR